MRIAVVEVTTQDPFDDLEAAVAFRLARGALQIPATIDLDVSAAMEARLTAAGARVRVRSFHAAPRCTAGSPPVGPLWLRLQIDDAQGETLAAVEALERTLEGVRPALATVAQAQGRVPFTVGSFVERPWANQGLGTALYVALAEIVGRVGGGLAPENQAGGITSGSAQRVWAKLPARLRCVRGESGAPVLCWAASASSNAATPVRPSLVRSPQDAMIAEASALAAAQCRWLGLAPEGACLVYAAAILGIAQRQGLRLVLQAGSAFWPRMTPEQDDGVSPTHFGYEWDPPNVARHLAAGHLPEMHAWAGDPVTQDLVDLTTGQFPAQCQRMLGAGWPGVRPPLTWWGPARSLPDGVSYTPNRDATRLAMQLLADLPR